MDHIKCTLMMSSIIASSYSLVLIVKYPPLLMGMPFLLGSGCGAVVTQKIAGEMIDKLRNTSDLWHGYLQGCAYISVLSISTSFMIICAWIAFFNFGLAIEVIEKEKKERVRQETHIHASESCMYDNV